MLTLEQAIARVPMWQGARDIKTTPLGGGITNQNWRVDVKGESFVLRIGGENTELLGIDRQQERAANQAAARIGVAPEVVYFIEPEGWLVKRFLNARPLPREEICQPENLRRVAELLRRVHALAGIPATFSPFRTVASYKKAAEQYGVAFPAHLAWLIERLDEIETALARDRFAPRLCHNDLLNENFLAEGSLSGNGGKIRIIDWEYAGMGDPAFDLANFAVHHQLSDEQETFLLAEYYKPLPSAPPQSGERNEAKLARHKLLKIASDLREATWGLVQVGISKLDFDFRGYADKHFKRAEEMVRGSLYPHLLQEFEDCSVD